MSGKFIAPRLALFLLAFGCGSTCVAGEPLKIANMSEMLSVQRNEQLLKKLWKDVETPFFRGGHHVFTTTCYGWTKVLELPSIPRSLNSLPDYPINSLVDAFTASASFRILILNPDGPLDGNFTEASKEFLYHNFLISRRVEAKDIFPEQMVFRWLSENLGTNSTAQTITQNSAEIETNELKETTSFTPNLVFEFGDKNSLCVELDLIHCLALVRTKDKWGLYEFSEASADAILSQVNDLHAIYANESTKD